MQINYKYNHLWVERGTLIECLDSLFNCDLQVLRKVYQIYYQFLSIVCCNLI